MRVCVSGYYGLRNTGDEAVLAGTILAFEARGAARRSDVLVLSADPVWTEQIHGVRAAPRMRYTQVRSALRHADVLLSGGGSLLQDVTSFRSLVYYLLILALARRCGVPYVLYAQGIGPLRRTLSRRLVRHAALRADAITVRDPGSAQLLQELGIPADRIAVTADPAFVFSPAGAAQRSLIRLRSGLQSDRTTVAFAVRPWPGFSAETVFRGAADTLAAGGFQVVWVPMQPAPDGVLSRRLARPGEAVLDPEGVPERALAYLACADVVVAMRLHALILGAVADLVPVAVAYDPKVTALMERLHVAQLSLPVEAASAEAVSAIVRQALADRDRIRSDIEGCLPGLRAGALRNVDCAVAAVT